MENLLIKDNFLTTVPKDKVSEKFKVSSDIIIPDKEGDAMKILCAFSSVLKESQSISGNRLLVSGQILASVIYKAESGEVKGLMTKIPFNHERMLDSDSIVKFCVTTSVLSSSATLINSRKLSFSADVLVEFCAFEDLLVPYAKTVASPEASVLTEEVSTTYIKGFLHDKVGFSFSISIPEELPAVKDILSYRLNLEEADVKAVTGKIILKSSVTLSLLYVSAEDEVIDFSETCPFTEIFDSSEMDETLTLKTLMSVADYDIDLSPVDDKNFELSLNGYLNITVLGEITETFSMVKDAFKEKCKTEVSYGKGKKCVLVGDKKETLTLKDSFELAPDMEPFSKVCAIYGDLGKVEEKHEMGKVILTGSVCLMLYYISASGTLMVDKKNVPFTKLIDIPYENAIAKSGLTLSHIDYNIVNKGKIDVRAIVNFDISYYVINHEFETLSGMCEGDEEIKKRAPLIIYFVKKGDTIWKVAKMYGVSPERLLSANGMTSDETLNIGKRLLIP